MMHELFKGGANKVGGICGILSGLGIFICLALLRPDLASAGEPFFLRMFGFVAVVTVMQAAFFAVALARHFMDNFQPKSWDVELLILGGYLAMCGWALLLVALSFYLVTINEFTGPVDSSGILPSALRNIGKTMSFFAAFLVIWGVFFVSRGIFKSKKWPYYVHRLGFFWAIATLAANTFEYFSPAAVDFAFFI